MLMQRNESLPKVEENFRKSFELVKNHKLKKNYAKSL